MQLVLQYATYNLRSISHAIAAADALNVPKQDFEFQILYGMADPVRKALRERGFNVRTYSPVGKLIPGMAYLVRRLLENTSNESFLRKSFSEKTSFDETSQQRTTDNGQLTSLNKLLKNLV